MPEWADNYVKINDLTIHYYRTGGSGKPQIILLHGVMDNGLCWTPVARDLREHYDVIMTDARGHGQTGGSVEDCSYKHLAADAVGLIEALGLDQPYLFGHSLGAMTSIMLAANHPELVRAVVLEDPPLSDKAPETPASEESAFSQILEFFQEILSLKTMSPEQRVVAARKYNPLWDEVELVPWADSKVEFNPEFFQHMEGDTSWRALLPRITCPILLVTGDPEAHALVTPQIAQEAASLWQQGEIIQIPGAGHCIHRDRYSETMPQILDFLSRV